MLHNQARSSHFYLERWKTVEHLPLVYWIIQGMSVIIGCMRCGCIVCLFVYVMLNNGNIWFSGNDYFYFHETVIYIFTGYNYKSFAQLTLSIFSLHWLEQERKPSPLSFIVSHLTCTEYLYLSRSVASWIKWCQDEYHMSVKIQIEVYSEQPANTMCLKRCRLTVQFPSESRGVKLTCQRGCLTDP